MVQCKLSVGEEEKNTLIDIVLNNGNNSKRRKILVPICIVLGVILLLFSALTFYINKIGDGVFFLITGLFITLWGANGKHIQKAILKNLQKKADKNMTGGERNYVFSDEGVHVTSNLSDSMHYWNSFKCYGEVKHYIYLKMLDNKFVLVDKNKLSDDELNELYSYLRNIKG